MSSDAENVELATKQNEDEKNEIEKPIEKAEEVKVENAEAKPENGEKCESSTDEKKADESTTENKEEVKVNSVAKTDNDEKKINDDAGKDEEEDEEEEEDTKKPDEEEDEKDAISKDGKGDTEDTEGTEEEEGGGGEKKDKKGVPLLDQPLEKTGTRERKKVQRFNEDFKSNEKEAVKFELPEGRGTALGQIPCVDAAISRFKPDDLKILHKLLFKMPGKTTLIKKNIKRFNGFDFEKDSDEHEKKLQYVTRMEGKQLRSICDMLELQKTGSKEELAERVVAFLLEPKDSGKPVSAAASGARPKRSAAVKANNRGYSSHEDHSDDDEPPSKRPLRARRGKQQRPNLKDESSSNESGAENKKDEENSDNVSEEGVSSAEDTPRVVGGKKGKGKAGNKKKDSDSDEFEESEVESSDFDSDEPKSKRRRGSNAKTPPSRGKRTAKKKKGTPKKSPAKSKKTPAVTEAPSRRGRGRRAATATLRYAESSDEESEPEKASSSEDEPLVVKKGKTPQPPTDDEIKSYVKEILEGANLEEITMKTVCKQVYAHYPDFDLAHKKDFIKSTVKSLIST